MEISKSKLITATMNFIKEDRLKSWYYFLSTGLLIFVAYTVTWFISLIAVKVFCSVLAGLLMARMFVIYHDYQHEAIFRKSVVARILMRSFGILALAPHSIWKETHEHHHQHNSQFARFVMGSFPTITAKSFRNSTKAQQLKYKIIRHPLMIMFAYIPIFLVSFCLWPFFENPRKYFDCGIAAVVHIGLGTILYFIGGLSALIYLLLIPSVVMFGLGGYIFYAQHNFPEVILRDDADWDYMDAALHSSSFIRMSRVMRWFTANIGYHHIHHVNSRIPFYRLPEVMDSLPELQRPRSTSLYPGEIWKCLQLKLWDETQGRMISWKEFKK